MEGGLRDEVARPAAGGIGPELRPLSLVSEAPTSDGIGSVRPGEEVARPAVGRLRVQGELVPVLRPGLDLVPTSDVGSPAGAEATPVVPEELRERRLPECSLDVDLPRSFPSGSVRVSESSPDRVRLAHDADERRLDDLSAR